MWLCASSLAERDGDEAQIRLHRTGAASASATGRARAQTFQGVMLSRRTSWAFFLVTASTTRPSLSLNTPRLVWSDPRFLPTAGSQNPTTGGTPVRLIKMNGRSRSSRRTTSRYFSSEGSADLNPGPEAAIPKRKKRKSSEVGRTSSFGLEPAWWCNVVSSSGGVARHPHASPAKSPARDSTPADGCPPVHTLVSVFDYSCMQALLL